MSALGHFQTFLSGRKRVRFAPVSGHLNRIKSFERKSTVPHINMPPFKSTKVRLENLFHLRSNLVGLLGLKLPITRSGIRTFNALACRLKTPQILRIND